MRTISVRVGFMAAIFSIAGLFQVLHAPISAAAPNPDSCFTTTGTTLRTITNYNPAGAGCGSTVEIPSTIGGGTVVSIGAFGFYNDGITSVVIPNSVTSIGQAAFSDNLLTTVALPNSLTTIGSTAFYYNRLTSLTLSNTLTSIGDEAFSTNLLTSVTIPDSVTTIGLRSFGYNNINDLTIGNSLSTITERAFQYNQLTTVTIPNSVTTIGNSAFRNNLITSLNLGNSVSTIEHGAFAINNLSTVTIPNSVTSLGNYAFGDNKIRTAYIPNSVTTINDLTFYMQSELGKDIPDRIYESDYTVNKASADGIWYVQLYTIDPSNPNGLTDSTRFEQTELDGDNDWDDTFNAGGYIVNPASAELQFVDATNNQLEDSLTLTGYDSSDDKYFNDYLVINGPNLTFPVNPYSPTAPEMQAVRYTLSQYYRIGDTFTYSAVPVNGVTPTPGNYSFVLGANTANNHRQFVYAAAATSTPSSQASGSLANTGMSIWLVATAAVVIALGSIGIVGKKL